MRISPNTKKILSKTGAGSMLASMLFSLIIAMVFSISIAPKSADAYTPSCTGQSCKFVFLAPLPIAGITPSDGRNGGDIELGGEAATQYIKSLYVFGIAVAAGLAVIMIVVGGIEMSTIDAMAGKINGGGREKINAALTGLALALLSYIILSTLNVNLLSANFVPKPIDADPTIGQSANFIRVSPGAPGSAGGTGIQDFDGPAVTGNGGSAGSRKWEADWNEYALQKIEESGLLNMSPSDAAKYFPDGNITAQGYADLMARIAKSESSFNPRDNGDHSQGYDVGSTYSVGLFSLTDTDRLVKAKGYSEQDLLDPYKNIDAAISIMANQVRTTGSIRGSGDNHYWGPLYRGEVR